MTLNPNIHPTSSSSSSLNNTPTTSSIPSISRPLLPCTTCLFIILCTCTFILSNLFYPTTTFSTFYYAFTFQNIFFFHETYRCFSSTLFHSNFIHLFMNMTTLFSLGTHLEKTTFGSLFFFLVILWSILWTSCIQLFILGTCFYGQIYIEYCIKKSLMWIIYSYFLLDWFMNHDNTTTLDAYYTNSTKYNTTSHHVQLPSMYYDYHIKLLYSWTTQSSIGFSGVLFHLLVLEIFYNNNNNTSQQQQQRSVYGLFNVSSFYYPWVLLIFIQILLPNVSFIGHVSGILSGYIQLYLWNHHTTTTNQQQRKMAFYLPSLLYLQSFEQEYLLPIMTWIVNHIRFFYNNNNNNNRYVPNFISSLRTGTGGGGIIYIPISTINHSWNNFNSNLSSTTTTSWSYQRFVSTCVSCPVYIYSCILNICRYTYQQIHIYCIRICTYIQLVLFGSRRRYDPHLDLSLIHPPPHHHHYWSSYNRVRSTEMEEEDHKNDNDEENNTTTTTDDEWIGIPTTTTTTPLLTRTTMNSPTKGNHEKNNKYVVTRGDNNNNEKEEEKSRITWI